MINLRGQILGVFNVRKQLSSKAKEMENKRRIAVMIVEQLGISVGMTVDEVICVLQVNNDKIEPLPLRMTLSIYRIVIQIDALIGTINMPNY